MSNDLLPDDLSVQWLKCPMNKFLMTKYPMIKCPLTKSPLTKSPLTKCAMSKCQMTQVYNDTSVRWSNVWASNVQAQNVWWPWCHLNKCPMRQVSDYQMSDDPNVRVPSIPRIQAMCRKVVRPFVHRSDDWLAQLKIRYTFANYSPAPLSLSSCDFRHALRGPKFKNTFFLSRVRFLG